LSILRKTKVIVIFLLLSCLSFAAVARENVIDNRRGIFHPVIATQGMVSTQEKLATQVGLEVLKEGGWTVPGTGILLNNEMVDTPRQTRYEDS